MKPPHVLPRSPILVWRWCPHCQRRTLLWRRPRPILVERWILGVLIVVTLVLAGAVIA